MENRFKPEGYNSVSPYFIVDGAQKLVDLLKEIFDAVELRRYELPDGKIMHMEIRIDDSVIMLADATDKYPANTTIMHVYVSNVDEVFQKAIHLGCVSVDEPKENNGDPDRRGTFKDFAGNMWSVGQQIGG